MVNAMDLASRTTALGVEIAWTKLGHGPPVVLVHGFPSNGLLWREIAPELAKTHTVYVYDVPGQGRSARRPDMDVSDAFQSAVLADLLRQWQLARPAIVLHDIGSSYGLGAYILEGCRFDRVALISSAVMMPCVTAATLHAKKYIEAYRTMPLNLYELIASARIRSTTFKPMNAATFEIYFAPWKGALGQALWYNRVAQIDERHTERLEAKLGPMDCPVRIIWGEKDTWIPVDQAERLRGYISNADVRIVPDAGHFVMDDDPEMVTKLIAELLRA